MSKVATNQTLTNQQTGNTILLTELRDIGYIYLEQHRWITIQAWVTQDNDYSANAYHLIDGAVAETIGHACLDDALCGLMTEIEETDAFASNWYAPQTLGI